MGMGVALPPARSQSLFTARARVECIGKGKAHRPYEFGVKVSVATTVTHSAGRQFLTHAGHTLATVIPQMQTHRQCAQFAQKFEAFAGAEGSARQPAHASNHDDAGLLPPRTS
jgi:hypothetical protein